MVDTYLVDAEGGQTMIRFERIERTDPMSGLGDHAVVIDGKPLDGSEALQVNDGR